MDAISKALQEVYFGIPKEILQLAYNDNPANAVLSLDEVILSRIIRPKILVDCNLIGGVEVYVPMEQCQVIDHSTSYALEYIINVPKTLTSNRSIITPIGIFSGYRSIPNTSTGSSLENAVMNQLLAIDPPAVISTARLELIGENKIFVVGATSNFMLGSLKVILENDNNLSNISPRSYLAFSNLVILGVKADIHNRLQVSLGQGYISNGHELGVVTDIINDYSSARDDYNEYLTNTWGKVAYHNDKERLHNHVAGML